MAVTLKSSVTGRGGAQGTRKLVKLDRGEAREIMWIQGCGRMQHRNLHPRRLVRSVRCGTETNLRVGWRGLSHVAFPGGMVQQEGAIVK